MLTTLLQFQVLTYLVPGVIFPYFTTQIPSGTTYLHEESCPPAGHPLHQGKCQQPPAFSTSLAHSLATLALSDVSNHGTGSSATKAAKNCRLLGAQHRQTYDAHNASTILGVLASYTDLPLHTVQVRDQLNNSDQARHHGLPDMPRLGEGEVEMLLSQAWHDDQVDSSTPAKRSASNTDVDVVVEMDVCPEETPQPPKLLGDIILPPPLCSKVVLPSEPTALCFAWHTSSEPGDLRDMKLVTISACTEATAVQENSFLCTVFCRGIKRDELPVNNECDAAEVLKKADGLKSQSIGQ
ncbi:hypothetical protein MRX96_035334 [Rhipicephalus microplus]